MGIRCTAICVTYTVLGVKGICVYLVTFRNKSKDYEETVS
jgi:hypothetical protein